MPGSEHSESHSRSQKCRQCFLPFTLFSFIRELNSLVERLARQTIIRASVNDRLSGKHPFEEVLNRDHLVNLLVRELL